MDLLIHEFELPLQHPFTISRGTVTVQNTLVVELKQDETSGFGEAVASDYYNATIPGMREHLESIRPLLEGWTFEDPRFFWEQCAPMTRDVPFVLAALDCAAHDLWGKLENQPVHQLWGLDPAKAAVSSFTIGLDTIPTMEAKLREMPGWPVYKIKLGAGRDMEIVKTLRTGTDALLRVDANCGWDLDKAIALSGEMRRLGVEFIEQPLQPSKPDDQQTLFRESALPIIADESCVTEADVLQCAGRFHGINIKLCKCGGLTPARRMIRQAREHGMQVMIGCMTESSVGISAAAQLAPEIDYADLDGAVLLARDAARGVELDRGKLIYPETPGCGILGLNP